MSGAGRSPGSERWGRAQAVAVGLGVAAIGFGAWQLLIAAPSATHPVAAVLWLAGALVAHDGILAPLTLLVAFLLSRALPARPRRVVAVTLFVLASLLLVAAPGWLRP